MPERSRLPETLHAAVGRRDCGRSSVLPKAGRCARAGCGNTARKHRRLLRRRRGGDRRQPEDPGSAVGPVPSSPMAMSTKPRRHSRPNSGALSDGVFTSGAPVLNTTSSAMPNTRCGQRCLAAEALSTIGLGSSDVANPRGLTEQLGIVTATPGSRPRAIARIAFENASRTSMRSSRSVPG